MERDLLAVPKWLREAGFAAWLLVGVLLVAVGVVWLLTLTHVIFVPLVAAGVIASVAGQLVSLLKRIGLPRGLGAALVLLLIVAAGVLAGYLVVRGIGTETSAISHRLTQGADKIQGWLEDLGVSHDKAQAANHDVSSGAGDSFKALINGLTAGRDELA